MFYSDSHHSKTATVNTVAYFLFSSMQVLFCFAVLQSPFCGGVFEIAF